MEHTEKKPVVLINIWDHIKQILTLWLLKDTPDVLKSANLIPLGSGVDWNKQVIDCTYKGVENVDKELYVPFIMFPVIELYNGSIWI